VQQTIDNSDHRDRLVDQFVKAFEDATGASILPERRVEVPYERAGGNHRLDLLLRVEAPQGSIYLAVELIGEGYPRDVRHAVWALDEYRLAAEHDAPVLPMVLAEHLSKGARESLRERNVAYFDSSGSLYLKHGQWLINIERAAKSTSPRRAASVFTDAREQVVHALLHSKQEWLTGLELAQRAETSAYTVSLTMQELERLEWVESQGSGRRLRRRLAQPGKLLDAWAEAWQARKESRTRWYTYFQNPRNSLLALTSRLDRAELPGWGWAFTGTAAANVLSPLLTNVDTVEVIVPPGRSDAYAKAMDLKSVESGSNVSLVERRGASTLFRRLHPEFPSWFASPFIQYLDLQDGRGRNKELAAHLRDTVLEI
jgi:hypothetical protein